MSTIETVARRPSESAPRQTSLLRRMTSVLPTWGLITTKNLELRRRRGLMLALFVLLLGPPVLLYGFRLLFHAIDPSHYGQAGTPSAFQDLMGPMPEFGFIIAVTVGAAAGTTDLTDGMFRHLVITGRSRIALFLARIPAGLAILLPVMALTFTLCCLVTSFEGVPNPPSISFDNGVSVPVGLSEPQFQSWLEKHPREAREAFPDRAAVNSSTASLFRVAPPFRATTPTSTLRGPSSRPSTRW